MRITSTANPKIKAVRRLHRSRERRLTGNTLLEGPKLLSAALQAGVVPTDVFTAGGSPGIVSQAEGAGASVHRVTRGVLDAISTTVEPQDPVAVIRVPPFGDLSHDRTLVLVEISDPGNMGTLIRTAAALGWRVGLIGGADPWNPKTLRAGAGGHFVEPLVDVQGVDRLEERGFALVGTVVGGGDDPRRVVTERAIALLVGSEAHGLEADIVDRCDALVSIPMVRGVESMNAAVAGAIAMYALDEAVGSAPRPPFPSS